MVICTNRLRLRQDESCSCRGHFIFRMSLLPDHPKAEMIRKNGRLFVSMTTLVSTFFREHRQPIPRELVNDGVEGTDVRL